MNKFKQFSADDGVETLSYLQTTYAGGNNVGFCQLLNRDTDVNKVCCCQRNVE